jgi:ABC-2 type transporter
MSATTTTPIVHGWPTRALSDVAVITRRNLLYSVRLPQVLVLSASMPVIFILMFTYVFGGAIQGTLPPAAAGRYVNWLIPGLLAQFALFGGAATASGLAEDLTNGVIDRFRSLPMAGAAVLAGRTQLGVRPHPDHARLAAAVRRQPARHRGHQRPAGPGPRPGRPPTGTDRGRTSRPGPALGGRDHRRVRPPGRAHLPPHRQLTRITQ